MGGAEVTVVVPTRDRIDSLRATLAGVLRQEDVALEVVVVNDGGSAPVAELVEQLADPRLRVLTLPRSRGPAGARNAGITEARARWVAFIDDDDLWAPSKLRKQLAAARSTGARWVWCGACYLDAAGDVAGVTPAPEAKSLLASLPSGSVIPAGASNVLVETELLRSLGGFDEALFHLPDWDLWIRLAQADPGASVDEPLVGYVLHSGMLSRRHSEMLPSDLARVESKLRAGGLRASDRAVHRGLLEWIAEGQVVDGRRGSAAATFARSALRNRSAIDALQAAGTALAGERGLALVRRIASRHCVLPSAPEVVTPAWLSAYPEFPWSRPW